MSNSKALNEIFDFICKIRFLRSLIGKILRKTKFPKV